MFFFKRIHQRESDTPKHQDEQKKITEPVDKTDSGDKRFVLKCRFLTGRCRTDPFATEFRPQMAAFFSK